MQYGIYAPSLWSSKAVGGDRMLVVKWPKCSCKGKIEMPIITTPPHDFTYLTAEQVFVFYSDKTNP